MLGVHYGYLDGWRGLAIALLLIGHFFPVPGINLGNFGVNLFFVLSGLLMSRLLFVQETPLAVFYKRRLSRIFPAHFAFLALIVLSYLALGIPVDGPETFNAALFVNNYFPGELGHPAMPFGHIWSLSVEEHSYVVLSAIALLARRGVCRPGLVIGAACIASVATGIGYWMHYSDKELYGHWLRTEVAGYGIFASALCMLWFERRGVPRLSWLAYPALAFAALALQWWSVPGPAQTFIGVALLALLVNLLQQAPAFIKNVLSLAPLRKLGLWSFSVYVWQQPFYLLVNRSGLRDWVGCLLALGCGALSFYLIENPARSYLNRVWARESDTSGRTPVPAASRVS